MIHDLSGQDKHQPEEKNKSFEKVKGNRPSHFLFFFVKLFIRSLGTINIYTVFKVPFTNSHKCQL